MRFVTKSFERVSNAKQMISVVAICLRPRVHCSPTVRANPSQKRSFSETLFKREEFGNRLCVLVLEENISFPAFSSNVNPK